MQICWLNDLTSSFWSLKISSSFSFSCCSSVSSLLGSWKKKKGDSGEDSEDSSDLSVGPYYCQSRTSSLRGWQHTKAWTGWLRPGRPHKCLFVFASVLSIFMGASSWSLCHKRIMRRLLECKFSFSVSLWQTLRALLYSLKALRHVLSVHITEEKRKENISTRKRILLTHKKQNNNEFISFSSMHIGKLAKRKEETNQANQIFTVMDFVFLSPDIFIPWLDCQTAKKEAAKDPQATRKLLGRWKKLSRLQKCNKISFKYWYNAEF